MLHRSRVAVVLAVAVAVLAAAGLAVAVAAAPPTGQTLTVRLWDPQVQKAYDRSFAAFEKQHPDLSVRTVLVPWSDYFATLRLDLAAGKADDVFWLNAGNFEDYASAGELVDITAALGEPAQETWQKSVVQQYTLNGALWGVPQLSDPGIGLLHNTALLRKAGLSPSQLNGLRWDPDPAKDTLLPVLQRLTLDSSGRNAAHPGFDPDHIVQYGFNAADDLNAITLNFLGSNGAALQQGDRFVFDTAAGRQAFQYLVDLINRYHVAPAAADTNQNSDFSRDQFTQGRMVLFQTGSYSLATVQQGARFEWGIAPLPAGPAGAISVANGVIAAANAHSEHPAAVKALLRWLGSPAGSAALAADGSASPAVLAAQADYVRYWSERGIDIRPLYVVLDNGTVQAPQGPDWAAAEAAFAPLFQEMFAGRIPVAEALRTAQRAANAASPGG